MTVHQSVNPEVLRVFNFLYQIAKLQKNSSVALTVYQLLQLLSYGVPVPHITDYQK
jgi:hypothetical protein